MRTSILLFVILFHSAPAVFGQLPSDALEGTWELVSLKLIYADSTVDRTGEIPPTLKILNSTHFAFGRQMGEEEVYAGGGRYSFDGDTYTEHIEFHSASGIVGQSITFDARVEDDLWYHSGLIDDFTLEEVWRKVDGPAPSER